MSGGPHFLKDLEVREMASLDHGKLATSIVAGIQLSSPPFRIALFGAWGSGKSTILKLVQDQIDASDAEETTAFYRTYWYNAWEHEPRGNLFHSLMAMLVEQLPDGVRYSRKGSAVVGRVLEAAYAHGRRFTKDAPRPGADATATLGVESNRADMDRFTEMLVVAGGKRVEKRFVVFIDDLDKCLPLHALALLESIKLSFGGRAPIVFVCSMDNEVLRQVVQFKYGNAESFFADRYIEKIFEFGFEVPVISTIQVKGLVEELYRRSRLGERSVSRERMDREMAVIEDVLSRAGLTLNPRQIKRIFNRFVWFLCLDPEADPRVSEQAGQQVTESLDPWMAWLLATEYWRELREFVSLYEEVAFRELGNQVTGHPIFPHSNDAAKQAFARIPERRTLLDFFRGSIKTSGESHLAESQEALRGQVMRFCEVDMVLRSFGM